MRKFLLASLLAFPALVFAAGPQFESQALFLSRSSITEGESVTAYTNIINNAQNLFTGSVAFSGNGDAIGAASISLPAGEGGVASITWQPTPGIYTVTAKLEDSQNAVLAEASAKLTVASNIASGSSASSSSSGVESASGIEQTIAALSPGVASATEPIFSNIDKVRRIGSIIVGNQLQQTKPKLPGNVPGVENSIVKTPNGIGAWLLAIAWTIYFYILTILRYVIVSAAFFYAVFLIFILYILYWIYRKIRPKRRY